MVVKYYSETLNKMFDKKEDLEKAEKDFEEANKKKLEAEKRALEKQEAKNKERAADAEVVQKAYDEMIEKSKKAKEAEENPELLKTAPHHTIIKRVDDARAVKKPILTWKNR